MAFPLFITPSGSIFSGDVYSSYFSLPISVGIGFLVIAQNFIYVFRILSSWKLLILGSTLFFFLIATIFAISDSSHDLSLFLLYILPILVGLHFWGNGKNIKNANLLSFLFGISLSLVFIATLHIIASFLTLGVVTSFSERGVDSIFGLFSIYQKVIYYPTLLAIGSYIVLAFYRSRMKWFFYTILCTDIAITGAREAILLTVVLSFFSILTSNGRTTKRTLHSIIFFAILFSLTLVVTTIETEALFIIKLNEMLTATDYRQLSGGRDEALSYVMESFDITPQLIIIGNGFSTGGELGTPHNQYIEWFLRGGIIFLLFNTFLLFGATYKALRSSSLIYRKMGFLLLAIILISNNINTPFRAPYSSIIIFIIIGFSWRKPKDIQ